MQEKESKIKMPILALLGIAIFLLLALSIFSIYALQRRHIEDEIQNRMEEVWQLEHVGLDKDAELLEGLIEFLQKDEKFRRAWQDRDREAMAEYGSVMFGDIRSKFPVTHFCLHELDGSCFMNLRNVNVHRDCKEEKEFVMQKAAEEGKVYSGIELGKCGSVILRVVYPWKIDDKLTGYIVLGEDIRITTTNLKETLGVEVFFTIDKSLIDRTHWTDHISRTGGEDNWDLYENFIISHGTMARMPGELELYLKELVSCDEHEHLSSFMRLSLDDRYYEAGFLPLIDASGRDIGDIIVLTDITKILAHIRVISSGLIAASVFMGIALFIFFYVFLSRIENNLVNAHRDLRAEISEREKVQQALQKNEEHLRTILDSSPDAILQIDKDMKITWVNKAATESDPKAMGHHCFECCAEKTNEPCEGCVCLKAFESGQLSRDIIKKECDGVISYWDEIAVPLRNRQGQFDRAIVIARNVTERQQAENTRRNLMEVLEAKNWELENIIHVTSHDLRTPLVTISGFSEELSYSCEQIQSLFSQEESTPETKQQTNAIVFEDIPESVDLIRASAAKMQSLLDGLVRMAKLGFSATEIVKLDMNKEIEEIIKTLGFQVRQAKAKIEADKLPLCYGDKSQVYQIFFNLISNAIKYLDPSRPGVIRISGREEDGESVYCVEDNGIGISEHNLSNVFKMFYRINPDHDEGEGIGLAVVRRIVNRHQGRVWIDSEEGKGSRFYVSLPQIS